MLFVPVEFVIVGSDEELVAHGAVDGLARGYHIADDSIVSPVREHLVNLVFIFFDNYVLVKGCNGLIVHLGGKVLLAEINPFDCQFLGVLGTQGGIGLDLGTDKTLSMVLDDRQESWQKYEFPSGRFASRTKREGYDFQHVVY